mmetsp:Transcript_45688/g.143408  ORF Transcript_45688/g.143408 Transcript_45688/m.143408 type:complete len:259 (+) Transcript_45688:1432-2208(+)
MPGSQHTRPLPVPPPRLHLEDVDVVPVRSCRHEEETAGVELQHCERTVVSSEVMDYLIRLKVAEQHSPCVLQVRLGRGRSSRRGRAKVRVESPQPELSQLLRARCHAACDSHPDVEVRAAVGVEGGDMPASSLPRGLVGGISHPPRAKREEPSRRRAGESVQDTDEAERGDVVNKDLLLELHDDMLTVAGNDVNVGVEAKGVKGCVLLQAQDLHLLHIPQLVSSHQRHCRLSPSKKSAGRKSNRRDDLDQPRVSLADR